MRNEPAIAAATEIRPGRYPDLDALDLYERVLRAFVEDWRIDPKIVDGFLVSPAGMATGGAMDIFVHENLADSLGIHTVFSETLNAGGATYAIMASRAALAITDWAGHAATIGTRRLRMVAPVCVGDTIRTRARVLGRRSEGDATIHDVRVEVCTENGLGAEALIACATLRR